MLHAAVTQYIEQTRLDDDLLNEVEEVIERMFVEYVPSVEEYDDDPTAPIAVDLKALRESCGQVVVITRKEIL